MFFLMITLEYFSARVSREMILYPSALHTKTCVLLLRGLHNESQECEILSPPV